MVKSMAPVLLPLPSPPEAVGGLWYSTAASTRFGRHFHHELELNVVLRGAVDYWFPDREQRVVAPSALWIPPHMEHELLHSTDDLSIWVYSFRTEDSAYGVTAPLAGASALDFRSAAKLALAELKRLDAPFVTAIPSDVLARICAHSREGLLRPNTARFNAVLEAVLALAWSGRCPVAPRDPTASCHPAVRRAANLLREAECSASRGVLAPILQLSPERLSRLFTEAFGIGLVQYRNHHRVQRFIHDYGQGGPGNMLRTALDVGFGSYVQFYRAFKQVTGYAPGTHLELVREGIVDPACTGSWTQAGS